MSNKIAKIFKLSFYYILFLLGLTFILWIVWARFIRERLPKDIPFDLTEFGFYTLLYICLVYIILIKGIIRPKGLNPSIIKIVNILFKPLVIVDETLKDNKYITKYYHKFIERFINRFNNINYTNMKLIYISYTVVPRLLLAILLCFDTFFMHKLALVYDFVLLGIFSLLHRYIIYSLKYAKEQYIKMLTKKYDDVMIVAVNPSHLPSKDSLQFDYEKMKYHHESVTIEKYVEIQVETQLGPYIDLFEYKGLPTSNEKLDRQYAIQKYNNISAQLPAEDFDILEKDFYTVEPSLVRLSINLEIYSYISSIPAIRYVKALIFSLYLSCWSYILFVSYGKVESFYITNKILNWLIIYIDTIEPFSGLFL